MWEAVAAGLHQRGYRTVAPDQPRLLGRARPKGARHYRLAELVEDAAAVADELGGGPVHVVGHDWGGPVAWMLAATQPGRVRTLTTISGPHLGAFLRSALRSRQALASWYIAVFLVPGLVERVLDPGTEAGRRRFVRLLGHFGHDPADAERDAVRLGRDGLVGGLAWYRAPRFAPFGSLLRPGDATVSAPTLLVWGDRDNAVLLRGIEMSAGYATGPCRVEVLNGISRWAPDEAPERLVPLIADHLASHRSSRRRSPPWPSCRTGSGRWCWRARGRPSVWAPS